MMDFAAALEELCAYTGLGEAEARGRMEGAYRQQVAEWREKPRTAEPAVLDFYRQTDSYLYELVEFNYHHQEYQIWRQLIADAVRHRSQRPEPLRVLDWGGGIGSVLLDLAGIPNLQLTYADVPGKTFDYAAWRFARHGLPVRMLDATAPDPLADDRFDVITCLEVFDHVVDPVGLARCLVDHLVPGGLLIASANFNNNDGEAGFHLNCDQFTAEDFYSAIAALGLDYVNTVMPRFFHKHRQ